jgi:subtilisin family serine protease
MKNIIISLILLLSPKIIFSQNYYYHFDNKIDIKISNDKLILFHDKKFSINNKLDLLSKLNCTIIQMDTINNSYTVIQLNPEELKTIKSELVNDFNIISIEPVVQNKDIWTASSNYFYLKTDNYKLLEAKSKELNFEIIKENKFLKGWYFCMSKSNSNFNSIEICNKLYEEGVVKITDPGWMYNFKNNCITEPDFNNQWALSNSGIDVNACNAWTITTGRPEIVVAIHDLGIDLNHSEFSNNLSALSYDCQSGTTPSLLFGDHGTHCAGIVGANQNGDKISGIAPTSTLMSLSDPLNGAATLSAEMGDGFNFAMSNGADVISNSWGDQGGAFFNNLKSSFLESCITNAIDNGRNGLGCVVVFSSGNQFPKGIDYPGNFSEKIIVVGSINKSGTKSSFSAIGEELDVMAPGEDILSTVPGNALQFKSGTSMACPMVAGIAALVLSVNRCLKQDEVKTIIELSCKKISGTCYLNSINHLNGGWDRAMGYGLVDAFEAVKLAHSLQTNQFLNIGGVDLGPSNPFKWSLSSGGCSALAAGIYQVKQHQITTTITYPYTQAPFLIGSTNGFSGASPNDGNFKFNINSINETSATVTSFVYEIISTTSGANAGTWIPCSPNDLRFNLSVLSSIEKNIYLQNQNVTNLITNYNATHSIQSGENVNINLPFGDFVINSTSKINFHASKNIILKKGFCSKAGSDFRAYVSPFFTCTQFPNGKQLSKDNTNFIANSVNQVLPNKAAVQIVPNPVTSKANAVFSLDKTSIVSFDLYNTSGKLLSSILKEKELKAGIHNIEFDMGKLTAGIYFYNIFLETGEHFTGKIVKE